MICPTYIETQKTAVLPDYAFNNANLAMSGIKKGTEFWKYFV